MKRLVVCSDGTWNEPDDSTNVARMARAVSPSDPKGTPQVVFYDQGVGTANWVDKWLGGITGAGLSKNVQDAYRFLMHNYEDGDEVFLFGFSRGAFTARSTAGFLKNCGLLHKAGGHQVQDAYQLYKRRDAHPKSSDAAEFRNAYSREVEIKFLGVWDTVGALGIPIKGLNWITQRKYQFHDVELSGIVKNVYHGIAIDERRGPYKPSIWKTVDKPGQVVEQVWFVGVHSDVGGGYADKGLGDVAFLWMKQKAERCGLAFEQGYINSVIDPNGHGVLHDSMNPLWEMLDPTVRRIGDPEYLNEAVHPAAIERYDSDPGYRPPNLTDYLQSRETESTENGDAGP